MNQATAVELSRPGEREKRVVQPSWEDMREASQSGSASSPRIAGSEVKGISKPLYPPPRVARQQGTSPPLFLLSSPSLLPSLTASCTHLFSHPMAQYAVPYYG